MRVSFIVPCLNCEATISACLTSILAQEGMPEYEVVVVDNGSNDRTREIVCQFPVLLVECSRRGRSQARNAGAALAKGAILAFVDSDTVLNSTWLQHMLPYFENPLLVAGNGIVKPVGNRSLIHSYRKELHELRERVDEFGHATFTAPPSLNSAAIMIRKRVFVTVGGFNEALSRNEDTDIAWRIFFQAGGLFKCSDAVADVYYVPSDLAYLRRSFEDGMAEVKLFRRWFAGRVLITLFNTYKGKAKLFSSGSTAFRAIHFFVLVFRTFGAVMGLLRYQEENFIRPFRPIALQGVIKIQDITGKLYSLSPWSRVIVRDNLEFWLSQNVSRSVQHPAQQLPSLRWLTIEKGNRMDSPLSESPLKSFFDLIQEDVESETNPHVGFV